MDGEGNSKRGGGASIDRATAEGIRKGVSEACAVEVDDFLEGKLEQDAMTQDCQKELMEAFRKTPLGEAQAREQVLLQQAAFERLGPKCKQEFKEAKAEDDVSSECHEKMGKEFKGLQQYVFQQTYAGLSDVCKTEFQELQKKPGGTGNDITPECMGEFQTQKPLALDIIEKQLMNKGSSGNGGGDNNEDGSSSGAGGNNMKQDANPDARQAAAAAERKRKRAASQAEENAVLEQMKNSPGWSVLDVLFVAVWILCPVAGVWWVFHTKPAEEDGPSAMELKLQAISDPEERERKRKILLRKEKEKQDKREKLKAEKYNLTTKGQKVFE